MVMRKNQYTESPGQAGRLGQLGKHEELDSPLLEIFMTGFDRALDSSDLGSALHRPDGPQDQGPSPDLLRFYGFKPEIRLAEGRILLPRSLLLFF